MIGLLYPLYQSSLYSKWYYRYGRGRIFNVYINARLSYECQQKTIKHELTHIARDDSFKKEDTLEKIETM
jgi:hypothetical protein